MIVLAGEDLQSEHVQEHIAQKERRTGIRIRERMIKRG